MKHLYRWLSACLVVAGMIAYATAWMNQWGITSFSRAATMRYQEYQSLLEVCIGFCFMMGCTGIWQQWSMRGQSLIGVGLGILWLTRANLEQILDPTSEYVSFEERLAATPLPGQLMFLAFLIAFMLYVFWLFNPRR